VVKRRIKLWGIGGLVAAVAIVAAHAWILRSIAEVLVVDDRIPDAACIVCIDGDHLYDVAAKGVLTGSVRSVLVPCDAPSRLEKYGILPGFWEVTVGQLEKRGVPHDAVQAIDKSLQDEWEKAECIAAWADSHSDQRFIVFVDRFESRKWRVLFDRFRGRAEVGVRALPDRRYDETNWWRSRTGIKSVLEAYLSLAYHWFSPVPSQHYVDDWDPDEYELSLRHGRQR
jgi:hypothetical protein